MQSRFALASAILALNLVASAQQPTGASAVNNQFVQNQFGATCDRDGTPPPLTGDLNGDNIEDIVIIARCTNPLIDEAEHNFKVIDPFNAFFGYGNPKITSQFASEEPANRGRVVLIIHGAGAEAWHSDATKAKFVIINLPFKQVSIRRLLVKKKPIMAIFAEETGGSQLNSAVFWDGKKYKYRPMGSSMQ
ncbi:MAG TPA: hypothetical protein VH744_09300 [Terriglobales bacterium]